LSISFVGDNQQYIFRTGGQYKPMGVALYGSMIYFSDDAHRAIFYGEKKANSDVHPYKKYVDDIVNLKTYQPRTGNGRERVRVCR
jgi:hypothetical protein